MLIGGCTGSGKTLLVQQQPNGVDLEGLARHRGSAFGRTLQPQLSQASFENLLAAEMLKTDARQNLRLWVLEDESRMIGSNHLPECLRERMTQAAIAVVEDPFEIRLERLNEEYFLRMHHDFTHAYGDEPGAGRSIANTCITDFRRLSVGWGYSAITNWLQGWMQH